MPSGKRNSKRYLTKLAALQLDKAPPFEEVRKEAQAALARAEEFLPALDQSEQELASLEQKAKEAAERAQEAERQAGEVGPRAEAALGSARKAIAELQKQLGEVSPADLHRLADTVLSQWRQEARPDSLQASVEQKVGISGVADAVLVAHSALAVVRGRKYVVTAIAAGKRFPEGALEGAVMHWGCSGSRGGSWLPPPAGWHTLPPISRPAGRAWQTTLGAYLPLVQGSAVASDPAHALVLQLPLEGVLAKGGALNFVLKRPQGMHPEWLQGSGNHDFRISFEKVYKSDTAENPSTTEGGTERGAESKIEGWVKREGEAAVPSRRQEADGGTLDQRFKAASAFLQSISERAEQNGGKVESGGLAEGHQHAKALLAEADQLIQESDNATANATALREEAGAAQRALEEGQQRTGQLQADSATAVLSARRAAAMLRGKQQEVGLPELQAATESRLGAWLSWVDSRRSLEAASEAGDPQEVAGSQVSNFRLYGLDGWVSARAALAEEGGRRFAVVSLAAGESFPEGVLEGVVVHWGLAGDDQSRAWEAPPEGWVSDPQQFHTAGGATESLTERMEIPGEEGLHAHALTLQLPLEGAVKRGGIKAVLRTQTGQWLACSYQGAHHDIFINLAKLGEDASAEKDAEPKAEGVKASTSEPAAETK